jgi:hypothetical protein
MVKLTPELRRSEAIKDQLALLIGRMNISWNDVQTVVFHLFQQMSGMTWSAADAIFFSIRSDSAQRDVTAALAKVALEDKPVELERLITLLNTVGKRAAERNAAIHTAWIVDAGATDPRPYMRMNAPKALRPDVRKQFSELNENLGRDYLALIEVRKALFPSWPDKALTPADLKRAKGLLSNRTVAPQAPEPPPRT